MAKRILWIFNEADLTKLDGWLAERGPFDTVVALTYEDSGAVALCFFDNECEAGIIRCASADLADLATTELENRGVEVVENTGGNL